MIVFQVIGILTAIYLAFVAFRHIGKAAYRERGDNVMWVMLFILNLFSFSSTAFFTGMYVGQSRAQEECQSADTE